VAAVSNLVSDGDARDRGAPKVVVGNKEGVRDVAQDLDLVSDVVHVGPPGGLNLTQDAEMAELEEGVLGTR